jgi:hypothetical protein
MLFLILRKDLVEIDDVYIYIYILSKREMRIKVTCRKYDENVIMIKGNG